MDIRYNFELGRGRQTHRVSIENPKELLEKGLEYFIKVFRWLPEYDEVVE